jgi:ribokinase
MKITATIIALNEERKIARAVESLRCCDEIVVLDAGSVDRTVELAEKLGARGVVYAADNSLEHIPGHLVEVVDTTAAGDAFAGALAVAICEGKSTGEACRFANAAAALSVKRHGAQTSMPWREEIDALLLEAPEESR